jgi:hypothetical protein
LTGKRPNWDKIQEQIDNVKQSSKDIKVARDVLQKRKPTSIRAEDDAIQFTD